MNPTRYLPAALLVAIFILAGCNKDKDPPPAPTPAGPVAPAAGPAAGQVRMVLAPGSAANFLIDAPLEKIKGRCGTVAGTLDLDSKSLDMSKGSFEVDLDGFKTSTFDDEAKNASQTEHMKNWLEIGPDVEAKLRERNRMARFTIKSIPEVSANDTGKIPSQDNQRSVTLKVSGDLLLHGVSSPKTVDIVLTFVGPPENLAFLRIATLHPLTISLKEHDIKPRDLAGKFLAGALEKVGQKIDDTVQISLDFKASR